MKRTTKAILLIFITAFLASCDLIQNEEPNDTGIGKVVISITDAPFPVKEVNKVLVNVDKVEMRVAGGLCEGTQGELIGKGNDKDKDKKDKNDKHDYENFECDSGFIVVFSSEKPVEIDLMKLQNGITTVLATADIPVGSYDMIRLRVVDATIVLADTSFILKVPSGNSSGIKIMLDNDLEVKEGDNAAQILLDFDLSRSFIALGNANGKKGYKGFIFKPVIRAVNHQQTGTIFGMVYDAENKAIEGAMVSVLNKDSIVTTAITDNKGTYKVIGLTEGTYILKVEKEGYSTATIPVIKVTSKAEIKKDIRL